VSVVADPSVTEGLRDARSKDAAAVDDRVLSRRTVERVDVAPARRDRKVDPVEQLSVRLRLTETNSRPALAGPVGVEHAVRELPSLVDGQEDIVERDMLVAQCSVPFSGVGERDTGCSPRLLVEVDTPRGPCDPRKARFDAAESPSDESESEEESDSSCSGSSERS
jgi:hypothetical protein